MGYKSFMQELDSSVDFDATRDAEFFASVPARPGVLAVEPRAELQGAQPYLLRSANLRQRLPRLLRPPEPASKRLNLREFAALPQTRTSCYQRGEAACRETGRLRRLATRRRSEGRARGIGFALTPRR